MAYLLRHDPKAGGLEMDEYGFVPLEQMLNALRRRWPELTEDDIREVVETCPKGRFEIREGKIRALYGHSLDVKVGEPTTPPEILYHGTSRRAAQYIMREGLKPQGRQYVHLTTTLAEAEEVARRHDRRPVVIVVRAGKAHRAGVEFLKSGRMYLVKYVPPEFLMVLGAND